MKIYLVRHGETEWNVLRRVQGSMDAPLTENGIQQAKNVAKRLAKVDFAAAFASPQMRAYRTAEKIVAEHPAITLQKEPSLREFSFGDWEGHKLDEMHLEEPEKWDCYQRTPSLFTAPHGDCMIARVAESKAFVDRLLENRWGQNVLCVTHGYAIRIFINGGGAGYSAGIHPLFYGRQYGCQHHRIQTAGDAADACVWRH